MRQRIPSPSHGRAVAASDNPTGSQEHYDQCCYPECYATPTTAALVPLCDGHAAQTYRRIAQAIRDGACLPATPRPTQRTAVAKFTPGEVYFIRRGDLIKIGFSTDVVARRRAFGAGARIIARMPGDQYTEKDLHLRFAHLSAGGEWFQPGRDLLEYIAKVKRETAA